MERAREHGVAGTRLVQSAYHTRSFALYTRLGFVAREQLACLQGPALGVQVPGHTVRPAASADLDACSRVCRAVHGHDRAGEVSQAIGHQGVTVVERDGRLTGYSTGLAFFGHTVGETVADVQALIGSADTFDGPGFLVPTRSSELLGWCLERGLRVGQLMTLMTVGTYQEPSGAYLPSILY